MNIALEVLLVGGTEKIGCSSTSITQLATYRIPTGFTPTVVSHENSKCGMPFYPTRPSTIEQIQSQCATKGPKQTIADVSAALGGMAGADCPGVLPRDEKQVQNVRHLRKKTVFQ